MGRCRFEVWVYYELLLLVEANSRYGCGLGLSSLGRLLALHLYVYRPSSEVGQSV